jgi:hypothetical protein
LASSLAGKLSRSIVPSDVAKEMIDVATHIAKRLRVILVISVDGT